jgi:hypothetical protein
VWSKAGRFVEGLHAVGDILTKISVNCVINLHAALLFTCLFLGLSYGLFPVYVACMRLLLFQCEFVHLRNVFVCLRFIYKASTRVLCVYVLIACS